MPGWGQGGRFVQATEHWAGSQGDGALQDSAWAGLDVSAVIMVLTWKLLLCIKGIFKCYFPFAIYWFFRVLIATQHFLKSSSLVENMYSEMSHHDRYFIFVVWTKTWTTHSNRNVKIKIWLNVCYNTFQPFIILVCLVFALQRIDAQNSSKNS